MKILVTGVAGFIGFHTAQVLLARGDEVIGLDNVNAYYDPALKEKRLTMLEGTKGFTFIRGDIRDRETVRKAMQGCDRVLHLAALAGVRYAFEHPEDYISININGFFEVLDEARLQKIPGFIYASSSSIYGSNDTFPSKETDKTDSQVSLYGQNKKENELMAHVYHHLYGMNVTGLRFFTVYGPWGRPDMALFMFTESMLKNTPINVFGHGKMQRDFTYIDDIVSGIVAAIDKNYSDEVFNLGCGKTEELMDYIGAVEKALGMEAQKNFMDMQPGDTTKSAADISKAQKMLGFNPQTQIKDGVPKFVAWYREYYNV